MEYALIKYTFMITQLPIPIYPYGQYHLLPLDMYNQHDQKYQRSSFELMIDLEVRIKNGMNF